MGNALTTDVVASPDRVSYWTDMICNVYVQLECDPLPCDVFHGTIVQHSLPALDISTVRSKAQRVKRTPANISRSTDDCILVSIQTEGTGVIRQDNRDAVLRPGDYAIYDSTRQYELIFEGDFEQVVLKLHGERLRSLVSDTASLTATRVAGTEGPGRLLCSMIGSLKSDIELFRPSAGLAIADGVMNVLAAGLQTLPVAVKPSLPPMAQYHLARIMKIVEERLDDPELSIASLADELGMSVGHIHRLFKTETMSPSQYIWSRRLEACARDLLDPRRHGCTVGDIAFRRGFNDAAHFSRAFKERFGMSPRDWRAHPTR